MERFVNKPVMRWVLAGLLLAGPARGAILTVGANGTQPTIAAAVRVARDGDTIRLAAGTYYECAVLIQHNLVLEGAGADTILSDRTCEGKGLLVIRGDGVTVRDLVLARARVPDMNGAGVRAEGHGLTLERVRFENNQVGVLAGQTSGGQMLVQDCVFIGGGRAGQRPNSALLVGGLAMLRVERSTFDGVKGAQITSGAAETVLVDNNLSSGVEEEAGGVVSASGRLVMEANAITIGPNPAPRDAAVVATGSSVVLQGNRMRNLSGHAHVLLLNWTGRDAALSGNVVEAGDSVVSDDGLLRFRAGRLGRDLESDVRQAAGSARRALQELLDR